KVIQSSWIKRRCPSHARAHDHEFFQDAERPTKKCRDYWSAAPADGTLAAHCRPNGKFGTSVQKAALDKIPHSSWRRKANDRSSSLDILSRAPESCFARVRTRNQKRLKRAAIALTYSRLTAYGLCKPSYLIGPGDKVITVAPFYPVRPWDRTT